MPPEISVLQSDIHRLGIDLAELRPLVKEVHDYMPRITDALECLARVTERLEANNEDHKRLHHRLSELAREVDEVRGEIKALQTRFSAMHDEHILCLTGRKRDLEEQERKQRERAASVTWRVFEDTKIKLASCVTWLLVGFVVWITVVNLAAYTRSTVFGVIKKAILGG